MISLDNISDSIHLLNNMSLHIMAASALFLILMPSIKLERIVEIMLWGLIFVVSGILFGGAEQSLYPNIEVAFRVLLAAFSVVYTTHRYIKARQQA